MARTRHVLLTRPDRLSPPEVERLQLWEQLNEDQAPRLALYKTLLQIPSKTVLNYSAMARQLNISRGAFRHALDWLEQKQFLSVDRSTDDDLQYIHVGRPPQHRKVRTLGHGSRTYLAKDRLPSDGMDVMTHPELAMLFYLYRDHDPRVAALYRYLRSLPDASPIIRPRVAGIFNVSATTLGVWIHELIRDQLIIENPIDNILELLSPGMILINSEDEDEMDIWLHGPAAVPELAVSAERLDSQKLRTNQMDLLLEFWGDARKAYFGARNLPPKSQATAAQEARTARLLLNDADAESYIPIIAYFVFWCADDDAVRRYGATLQTLYRQLDRFRYDANLRKYTAFGEDIRQNGLEDKWGHVVERFEQAFRERTALPKDFVPVWEREGKIRHPETGEFLDVTLEWDQIPLSSIPKAFSLLSVAERAERIPLLTPAERQVLAKELTPTT